MLVHQRVFFQRGRAQPPTSPWRHPLVLRGSSGPSGLRIPIGWLGHDMERGPTWGLEPWVRLVKPSSNEKHGIFPVIYGLGTTYINYTIIYNI